MEVLYGVDNPLHGLQDNKSHFASIFSLALQIPLDSEKNRKFKMPVEEFLEKSLKTDL